MESNSLPIGYVLQEYCIEKLLGVGGFGLTYLATDTNLNLKVAIKEYMPSDFAARSEDQSVLPKSENVAETFHWGRQRFIDESKTLASFHHPNIVRVLRFFEANHTAYIIMEFVAGSALPDWVKPRRPLSQKTMLNIALPLLGGLNAIHKSGYLHRDIKPGNIYMREDGTPMLLDFGSARQVSHNSELTVIATMGYAPLEQYHTNGNQGAWSDLYAFGGTLYWMLTGSKPVDAVARVRNDPQIPATSVSDGTLYTHNFLAAIDWALQPLEESRPQSVDDFVASLNQAGDATVVLDETQPIIGFNVEVLQKISTALTKYIGPIAPTLVKSATKKSHSITALIAMVAEEIPDEKQRASFIKKLNIDDDSKPISFVSADQTSVRQFGHEILERMEKQLAQHIGAVARIAVKRAAAKAIDENQLYLLIADEIEDTTARKLFMQNILASKK